ncbi:MAG: hypothetical protein AB1467_05915 [Candidatus Diapherotrites archaeon]
MAVLFIIVGIINYLEQVNYDISLQRITEGIGHASKSPDGTTKAIAGISIPKGSFNSKQLGSKANIDEKCIKFNSSKSSAFTVSNSSEVSSIQINQAIKTNVFVKCDDPDIISAISFSYSAYSQGSVSCESSACPEFCCIALYGMDFPKD